MTSIQIIHKHAGGRPRLWESPQELEERIKAYKEHCDTQKSVFSMTGLALALGCDRKTLLNYSKRDEFFLPIKRAKAYAECCLEELLVTLKDPRGVIFSLKNNFGWKNTIDIDVKKVNIKDLMAQLAQPVSSPFGGGYQGEIEEV